VAVFIDAENIYFTERSLKWRISYSRLIKYLKKECPDVKCYVYKGIDKDIRGSRNIVRIMENCGYYVKTKPIKKIDIGEGRVKWKSNLDMALGFDLVELADSYDTAILFSGDSDFALPLSKAKALGKRVLVVSAKGHASKELLDLAKYVRLNKLKDDISQNAI